MPRQIRVSQPRAAQRMPEDGHQVGTPSTRNVRDRAINPVNSFHPSCRWNMRRNLTAMGGRIFSPCCNQNRNELQSQVRLLVRMCC